MRAPQGALKPRRTAGMPPAPPPLRTPWTLCFRDRAPRLRWPESHAAPQWQRSPCASHRSTRTDRVCRVRRAPAWRVAGKCAVRSSAGRRGGCRGYESSSSPAARSGSSAASIVDCRPPYECPPRKILPGTRSRSVRTAPATPARSCAAIAGKGGPCGRAWRTPDRIAAPPPRRAQASASATSSGAWLFDPRHASTPARDTRDRRECAEIPSTAGIAPASSKTDVINIDIHGCAT